MQHIVSGPNPLMPVSRAVQVDVESGDLSVSFILHSSFNIYQSERHYHFGPECLSLSLAG